MLFLLPHLSASSLHPGPQIKLCCGENPHAYVQARASNPAGAVDEKGAQKQWAAGSTFGSAPGLNPRVMAGKGKREVEMYDVWP